MNAFIRVICGIGGTNIKQHFQHCCVLKGLLLLSK